jgi:peptide/nickel transport system substrate-binding protein
MAFFITILRILKGGRMSRRPVFHTILVVLIIASLALSGCSNTTKKTSNNKVATLIFTQEPESMNTMYTNMYFSQILQQAWDVWAWQYDDQNKPYPVLVTELPSTNNGGISSDGKMITLHLRDDIIWSDGKPLTSADFKFTYEMYINPNNAVATTYPYSELASLETPDARTIVMKFNDPFAPWLSFWKGIVPEHILKSVFDQEGTLDNAAWNKAPTVGAGPFVFSEWQSGSYLRFVRNAKYWGPKAKLDEIFVRIVPDDASQVAALKAGDGDLGIFISYPDVPDLEAAGIKIVSVNSGYSEGMYFNLGDKGHPALKDVKVRQALAYAIDRDKIAKDLLLGKTKPGATLWDNMPYVDPSLKPYPFDQAKAKQLLDEAGWKMGADGVREKDGIKLNLRYGTTTRDVRQSAQAIIQQMLAEVGIKVELLNYDSDIFFASYADSGPTYSGELDIYEWSDVPTAFPDPDIAYWLCSEIPSDQNPQGLNAQFLCDTELDGLFQAQTSQVDYAQRVTTFHKITKLMYDQVYWLSLWLDPDIWAISSRLQSVKLSGSTPLYNIGEWTIK